MSYIYYNPNPMMRTTDDCVIRAISKLIGMTWEETYAQLCVQGAIDYGWGSDNLVWGNYLKRKGYRRKFIPDTCPNCYTVKDFCSDNPVGRFLMAISGHVVTVIDGDYYDTFDSGNEIPIYYWEKQ